MLEMLWDKVNTPVLLVGMKDGTVPMDVSVAISPKIRNQPAQPSNTTFGYIFKRCSIVSQGHLLNYAHSSFVCHTGNNLNVLNRRMGKENVMHLHNGVLHRRKK